VKSEYRAARLHLEKAQEIIASNKLADGDLAASACCEALDLLIEAILAMEFARSEAKQVLPFEKAATKKKLR
jgi:hypothetical protein